MWPSTLKAFSLANIWRCFPHVYTQSSGPCRHFGRDKISFFACGWPPMSSGTNEFDVTNEFGENTHGRCLFFFYIYICLKKEVAPFHFPPRPNLLSSFSWPHGRHMFDYIMMILIICLQIRSQAFCSTNYRRLLPRHCNRLLPCSHDHLAPPPCMDFAMALFYNGRGRLGVGLARVE